MSFPFAVFPKMLLTLFTEQFAAIPVPSAERLPLPLAVLWLMVLLLLALIPPPGLPLAGTVLISIHTMANPGTCGGLSLRATNGSAPISPFLGVRRTVGLHSLP